MNYKKIFNVFCGIYNGIQKVGFELEGLDKYIWMNAYYVTQKTGVQINEVEILIGSFLKPEFYQIGEEMESGKIYGEGPSEKIVKTFHIKCSDTVEKLRQNNADKLKDFQKIKKVFTFFRNNKNIVGFDVGKEKSIYASANLVQSFTNLCLGELHILEGSFVAPEYYQKGENIYEGMNNEPELCRKSGVILKDLKIRLIGDYQNLHENFENSVSQQKPNPIYKNVHQYFYGDSYDSTNWLEDASGEVDNEILNDVYWNLD